MGDRGEVAQRHGGVQVLVDVPEHGLQPRRGETSRPPDRLPSGGRMPEFEGCHEESKPDRPDLPAGLEQPVGV
jgi:hypothetical protein